MLDDAWFGNVCLEFALHPVTECRLGPGRTRAQQLSGQVLSAFYSGSVRCHLSLSIPFHTLLGNGGAIVSLFCYGRSRVLLQQQLIRILNSSYPKRKLELSVS
jgi:hypothetical protein